MSKIIKIIHDKTNKSIVYELIAYVDIIGMHWIIETSLYLKKIKMNIQNAKH